MQIQRQMSILYQYHDILFLVRYSSIYDFDCVWYARLQTLLAQVSGLLTFKVATLTMFLHRINFGLSLTSVTDFSNTGSSNVSGLRSLFIHAKGDVTWSYG